MDMIVSNKRITKVLINLDSAVVITQIDLACVAVS